MNAAERKARGLRERDRLWGFGWAGWVLSAVAFVLLIILLGGYDLRFQLMSLMARAWGGDAPIYFVGYVLTPHGLDFMWLSLGTSFSLSTTSFGLATMAIIWIVLRLHPRATRWYWYVLVGLMGVGLPIAGMAGLAWIRALLGLNAGENITGSMHGDMVVQYLSSAAATVFLLAVIFRKWYPIAVSVTLVAIGAALPIDAVLSTYSKSGLGIAWGWPGTVIGWLWIPAWIALLLPWAILARRKVPKEGQCPSCGYDLSGLQAQECPECGYRAVQA